MIVLANGSIRVPEDSKDLTEMWGWLERQHTVAVDTETTGLDIYADSHRLRLIAFATPTEAWVYPYEEWGHDNLSVTKALHGKALIMCNASYDIQVLAKHIGINPVKYWSRTRDIQILAHQIDPREQKEGGFGKSLEALVGHYIPEYAKLGDELYAEFMRLKSAGVIPKNTPKDKRFATMPVKNFVFLMYAGMDAILTAKLYKKFSRMVNVDSELTKNDHKAAMIASLMDAQGFLLDLDYTHALRDRLLEEEYEWKQVAKSFGLENINSSDQVLEALARRGFVTTRTTKKGNPSADKYFLEEHREDPLVEAIIEGKRAGKWRSTWVKNFLQAVDLDSRVHPSTNTLRARTARFSISGIPAQTLPSTDALIRSCFVADTGEVVIKADYKQQEPRFAAAMSPEPRMIRSFQRGEDLYVVLAEAAWPGKGLEMRWAGKGGLLTTLYGGGQNAMMDQWNMTAQQSSLVQRTMREIWPGLKRKGNALAREAQRKGYITTWTGRKLPVDQNRLYSAMNYYVQSGCRDVTVHAMIRLYDAGFLPHMRLAIHDELLFSGPDDPDFAREVERIMSTTIGRLEIPAEATVGSRSWGSLYEGKKA